MESIKASQRRRFRRWVLFSYAMTAVLLITSAAFGYHASSALDETAELGAIPFPDIYRNNVSMLGTNMLGALLLGIPNLISGIMNGYAMGSAAAISLRQFGGAWMARSFLPHGVLEIPVILVSVSLGLLPWLLIANRIRRPGESQKPMIAAAVKYMIAAGIACAAILLPAAWVEANVSMSFIG